jgi:hypothetical protein
MSDAGMSPWQLQEIVRKRWQAADGASKAVAVLVWIIAFGPVFLAVLAIFFDRYVEVKPHRSFWQATTGLLFCIAVSLGLAVLGWLALKDRLTWRSATLRGAPWGGVIGPIASMVALHSMQSAPIVIVVLVSLGLLYRSSRVFLIAGAVFLLAYWVTIVTASVHELMQGQHHPS